MTVGGVVIPGQLALEEPKLPMLAPAGPHDDRRRGDPDDASRLTTVERDASRRAAVERDTSTGLEPRRLCAWCAAPIPAWKRSDAETCSNNYPTTASAAERAASDASAMSRR